MAAPPANVPLAPVDGAVNVTLAPLTGLLPLSLTVACKAVGKAVLITMLCGVPAVGVMAAGGPERFVSENAAVAVMAAGGPERFVSENAAGAVTPLTVAFTV